MVKWHFSSSCEKDIENIVSHIVSVMEQHNLSKTQFELLGEQYVEVEILRTFDEYDAYLIEQDNLATAEFDLSLNKVKTLNETVKWEIDDTTKSDIEFVTQSFLEFWKKHFTDVLYTLTYFVKDTRITHTYDDEIGFIIHT